MGKRAGRADAFIRPPRRGDRRARERLLALCGCVATAGLCVVIALILITRQAEYRQARDEYAAAQAIWNEAQVPLAGPGAALAADEAAPAETIAQSVTAVAPESVPAPSAVPTAKPFYSYNAVVARLREQNKDTVGWLDILNTDMQYPLVRAEDNEYYMKHTFAKKRNDSGAIFMDCWNLPDFSDFNTVIYGHNMKDGSMFSGLRSYRHQSFFNEHPYIEVTLIDRKLVYRVFAAYTAEDANSVDFRGQACETEGDRAAFILAARKRSTGLQSDYTVSREDTLLTLVTCAGGAQPWFWVVHGVLIDTVQG